jgi:hypothetical protein
MTIMSWIRRRMAGDAGAALMMVLMAGAVLTASALVVVNLSLTNLQNAGRDRVAGGAMGAAEAALSEGVNYLETHLAAAVNCSPTCATNTWGSSSSPTQLTFPDGGTASVWIEVLQAFNPPSVKVATYKIHAVGRSGTGPGQRVLEQTVTGKPLSIPIGVYATNITINGTPQTFQESVFSKNCIGGRNKMNFGTQPDAYFGIKPAAHSTQWIYDNNGSCSATNNNNIHKAGPCNSTYPYDQDAQGAAVASPCLPVDGTSKFTQSDLDGYGKGLTDDELANLRAQAQAQGNYWTSGTSWTPPNPTTTPNAVIFFDLPASGSTATVTIQNELDGYAWNGLCATTPKTLIIVVNNATSGNGGVTVNSNVALAGALFVQHGTLKFNGNAVWTGTIWADTIEQWNGSATSQLTSCFLQNLPGGLMSVKSTRFREVDR